MAESECKRCGTDEDRVHGYCSVHCREIHEVEQDRDELKAKLAEAEKHSANMEAVRDELSDDLGEMRNERDELGERLAEAEKRHEACEEFANVEEEQLRERAEKVDARTRGQ